MDAGPSRPSSGDQAGLASTLSTAGTEHRRPEALASRLASRLASEVPVADVKTFDITRDEDSGGGFHVGLLAYDVLGESYETVTIGHVEAGGPASRAGMDVEHIGWRVVRVDGQDVDGTTCLAALDATRAPRQRFTLSVQRPLSGELTLTSADPEANTGQIGRYVNPQDMDISFQEGANGCMQLRVALASRLLASVGGERMLQELLQQLGLARAELNVQEAAALAEEENIAAELDIDCVDDLQRCVVCLSKQRAVLLLPCRHLATCHKCTVLLRRMGKCPLCRQQIDDVKIASELTAEDTFYVP